MAGEPCPRRRLIAGYPSRRRSRRRHGCGGGHGKLPTAARTPSPRGPNPARAYRAKWPPVLLQLGQDRVPDGHSQRGTGYSGSPGCRKKDKLSYLPPHGLLTLASRSAPEAVVNEIIGEISAGERPSAAQIKSRISQ